MNYREIDELNKLIEIYKVEIDSKLFNLALAVEFRDTLIENQQVLGDALQKLYPVTDSLLWEFLNIPMTVSEEVVEDNEPEG